MLDMLDGIRRYFQLRLAKPKRKPRRAPLVDRLESRELQTIIAGRSALVVNPGLLPNTGRQETIHVLGAIATTSHVPPDAFYFVTDEYRRVEPHGNVKLTPIPPRYGFNMYAFDFNIKLVAQRSTRTPDGRHYNIFVGGKDADTTDGRTVSVYVPKQFPSPRPATIPRAKTG